MDSCHIPKKVGPGLVCAKMWACATQNRQPAAPAADCRTRIHPLTAWWQLDRHQAVIRGRSQQPLSSNSLSIAILAPCLLKHDAISRCHQGPLTDAHRLCDTGTTYEGNITSRGETRHQKPSSLDCVRHLDLAHGILLNVNQGGGREKT